MIAEFLQTVFGFDAGRPLLFTQFYFWAFFAVVFAGIALLQNRILLRNSFLFFVSLFFYFKTSGLFVLILLFTTLFNYFVAKPISHETNGTKRNLWLFVALAGNLLTLFYFKYAYFFTGLINDLFGLELQVYDLFAAIGNSLMSGNRFDVSSILLPVGISFYTFQNISYVMDVYRRRVKPVTNVLNFGFYVCFFPSLVAGPIVRASDFIPQLYRKYHLSRRAFGIAVFWILNGLTKKIVLSDYLATNFIDRIFENPTMFTGFENLMALFAYSLQVYADFSGYTDIAIGVALLMGFHLPKNFDSPYKATNAGAFWKRWHISLSKWLQDYLYIPMGGNRRATPATYIIIIGIALVAVVLSGSIAIGIAVVALVAAITLIAYKYPERKTKINTNLNMMNTMLLGGIWHGASWNFMIWGGLNGLGMLVYKFWRTKTLIMRLAIVFSLSIFFGVMAYCYPHPLFNIGFVWIGITCLGVLISFLYSLSGALKSFAWLGTSWAIAQTFVFISFTRLFFRSGSNLDPAEANQTAWSTAKGMVTQIGSNWGDLTQLGSMLYEYRSVFVLFVLGMIIHWLPDWLKRRYRLLFARMPLGLMAVAVVITVFIIYQFITADLQSFIYFQF